MTKNKINEDSRSFLSRKKWAIIIIAAVCAMFCIAFVTYRNGFMYKCANFIALRVIPSTLDIKPPDYYAVDCWRKSLDKMNIDVDVVFFGNSITKVSAFHTYFENVSVCNLGYSGDNLKGMNNRISLVKTVKPEKVFIMGGVNDLAAKDDKYIIETYKQMLVSMKDSIPTAQIYVQSILPIGKNRYKDRKSDNERIIRLNKQLETIAKELQLTYVDIFSLYYKDGELDKTITHDGIHLYPEAYNRWAEKIRPYIYEKSLGNKTVE